MLDEHATRSLRHVLLKTRAPRRDSEGDYASVYRFWLEMWRATFAEVDARIELFSDVFLTHREVSAVLHDNRPLGLIMYDFRDLRVQAHRDMKYFKPYPDELLDSLRDRHDGRVMMTGQLTIHPDFRRRSAGPFMSELLVGLATRRFLSSGYPVMIAFTRNDRNAHELAYRFGAEPLQRGVEAYGIGSDLVAFYPDRTHDSELPGLSRIIDRLWHATDVAPLLSDLPPALSATAENDVGARAAARESAQEPTRFNRGTRHG
jgi:hypothetical protein